ncbi:peptide chain release factor N(5)-glutamine methyltransferase [Sphingomonas koreensis]|nr:peptide chain release factor N(5)-glutamine methyltransferase [Sphingomonas koreensis]PJI88328.1 release factor glutamine methyltransferase [Sphingomonas koreensis]RSU56081.1 peptide chain release factor N(5)-glutamine methyltransferase [Sphingomonas koreensis]RSU64648.1 peptide chain release factor N(5)-glutamine methyltransferase [Sphingomonas koreensis]
MTVRAAIAEAASRIASETPRLDAELLMAHALGVSRQAMLLSRLGDPVPEGFAALVERRLRHEPVAYITGSRGFWTIELQVGPGVLVPRADSETLIEAAVVHFAGTEGPKRVLDLGTGPGTLLLAALAEWPQARGLGVDASETALGYARENAERLGLSERVELHAGDWAAGVYGAFDLILCNPPYIGTGEDLGPEVRDHEPARALFAGADGLDDYRRIVPDLPRLIGPGGIAVLEIGWTQGVAVSALVEAAGLTPAIRKDLGGRDRAVTAS